MFQIEQFTKVTKSKSWLAWLWEVYQSWSFFAILDKFQELPILNYTDIWKRSWVQVVSQKKYFDTILWTFWNAKRIDKHSYHSVHIVIIVYFTQIIESLQSSYTDSHKYFVCIVQKYFKSYCDLWEPMVYLTVQHVAY